MKGSRKLHVGPWQVWHVMISPKPGTIPPTIEGIKQLRTWAREAAKHHGIVGGCSVIHHSMKKHPGEWRPHVHIIGFVLGRWLEGPIHDGGPLHGHTIKIMPIRGAEDARNAALDGATAISRFWKHVLYLLHYELGHCIRLKGFHSLTWWGELSYNKLEDPTDEEIAELEDLVKFDLSVKEMTTCPVPGCGRPLVDVEPFFGCRETLLNNYEKVIFTSELKEYEPFEIEEEYINNSITDDEIHTDIPDNSPYLMVHHDIRRIKLWNCVRCGAAIPGITYPNHCDRALGGCNRVTNPEFAHLVNVPTPFRDIMKNMEPGDILTEFRGPFTFEDVGPGSGLAGRRWEVVKEERDWFEKEMNAWGEDA